MVDRAAPWLLGGREPPEGVQPPIKPPLTCANVCHNRVPHVTHTKAGNIADWLYSLLKWCTRRDSNPSRSDPWGGFGEYALHWADLRIS